MKYTLEQHKQQWIDAGIEYGLCLCGCGEKTKINTKSENNRGRIKGEPQRFVAHHQRKESKRPLTATEIECVTCGETKPSSEFPTYLSRGSRYYRGVCRVCESVRNTKNKRAANYGVTPESYDKMMNDQNGCCPICLREFAIMDSRAIHVDHCHDTGFVRGILCHDCNLLLGNAKDDQLRLKRASVYLAVSRIRPLVGQVIMID